MSQTNSSLYRSRAPLRIGFAGGGTDVSPYSELYGGAILNSTVDLYAHASLKPLNNGRIVFESSDRDHFLDVEQSDQLEIDDEFALAIGVYNRLIKEFGLSSFSFQLTTHVDAPPGSGLGSSSTLVVAILGCFAEYWNLPLGEYDLAHLAYEIERVDLNMSGGKQDQYAATFGGFNFMEFSTNDQVIVNPLRVRTAIKNELERCSLLYYTQISRLSSEIIKDQIKQVESKQDKPIEAMHQLKKQAFMMKEALLKGELNKFGQILDFGWSNKKQMSGSITNDTIDKMYEAAKTAGATGGKISGAGGGGFMVFYCPENSKQHVKRTLEQFGGSATRFHFTNQGLTSWRI